MARTVANNITRLGKPPLQSKVRGKIPHNILQRAIAKSTRPNLGDVHYGIRDPVPGVLPRDHKGIAQDSAIPAVLSWSANSIGALGSSFAEGTEFLGYSYLAVLAQRAEFYIPSAVMASEMTREWITLKSVDDDKDKGERIKELTDALKEFGVQDLFRYVAESDGLLGRGHIYIDTKAAKDGTADDELKIPIGDGRSAASREKIKKGELVGFRSVEATWAYPTDYNSNNPLAKNWYKPEYWFCMGKKVHHTRFLTVVGRPVRDLLKPVYMFGGLSLTQMLKPYVENWLRTRQSVADIVTAFSIWVVSTNLNARLAAGGSDLEDRVELFNLFRNNSGTAVLDKDTETLTNVSAPLGTLDQLLSKSQEQMASVARIPLVKLFGIQPTGLNASSEGEIRVFYDEVAAAQERMFRKPLRTVIDFVMLHLWGEVDEEIVADFNPLWQLDEAAKAAVQATKATTHDTYVAMGAIDPRTSVRESLARDPDSPYSGLDLDEEPPPTPPEAAGGGGGESGEGGETTKQVAQPGTVEEPGASPKTSHLGSAVTNRAAEFGGIASGGFKAHDALETEPAC